MCPDKFGLLKLQHAIEVAYSNIFTEGDYCLETQLSLLNLASPDKLLSALHLSVIAKALSRNRKTAIF
nr:hypothetical transcript [Hymenolepis microstoma]